MRNNSNTKDQEMNSKTMEIDNSDDDSNNSDCSYDDGECDLDDLCSQFDSFGLEKCKGIKIIQTSQIKRKTKVTIKKDQQAHGKKHQKDDTNENVSESQHKQHKERKIK